MAGTLRPKGFHRRAELIKQNMEQTSNLIDISFTYYMFNIHID